MVSNVAYPYDPSAAPGFGTAASKDVGTSPGNVVQVQTGGKLPPLDGSALTNVASGAPSSTDVVSEGSNNLYSTVARSRGAISVGGSLGYDQANGKITYTTPSYAAVASSGSASDLLTGILPAARLPSAGSPGVYGSSTAIPVITTDIYGRVTSVALAANAGGGSGSEGSATVTGLDDGEFDNPSYQPVPATARAAAIDDGSY